MQRMAFSSLSSKQWGTIVKNKFSSYSGCNTGPEGDEKEGEQANSIREESPAEDPIELLNRMSGKSDRSAKPNLSPITPTFEHDGYTTVTCSVP
jgi:hypothetical protein